MTLLALGYPGWPHPSTSWDWWPFVGIACMLVVLHGALRLRPRPGLVMLTIAGGPLFATSIHRWGVLPVLTTTLLGWAGLMLSRRRPAEGAPPGGV
jgi:hypothetical protein